MVFPWKAQFPKYWVSFVAETGTSNCGAFPGTMRVSGFLNKPRLDFGGTQAPLLAVRAAKSFADGCWFILWKYG